MSTFKRRSLVWHPLVAVPCLLAAAGCRTVGWLPDSSGFVYTDDRDCRRLVHYDVTTGKRNVLVAQMPARTPWPAVSPDGKHVAVARLLKAAGQKKADALQVILYDLKGKEVRRSPEFPWGPARDNGREDYPYTGVFWVAGVGRLIVQDYEEP